MAQIDAVPARKENYPVLRMVLDFAPLAVFLVGFFFGERLAEIFPFLRSLGNPDEPDTLEMFIATALTAAATFIALAISLFVIKRVPIMLLVTGSVVLVLGGLTLFLKDETFFKMKPTIVNILFASVLLGGLLFNKALVGYMFGTVVQMTDEGWRKLTLRWGVFFLGMAALNEIVWRSFSTEIWVAFKFPGIWILTVGFTLTQLPLIMREQARVTAAEADTR